MRFTFQQTFLLGSAILLLPALAAPIANPSADVAFSEVPTIARGLDMGSLEKGKRGVLGDIMAKVGGVVNAITGGSTKPPPTPPVQQQPPPPPPPPVQQQTTQPQDSNLPPTQNFGGGGGYQAGGSGGYDPAPYTKL